MTQKSIKVYLDEVCDMLDQYGGRDKVDILYIHFFCINRNLYSLMKKKISVD